VIDDEFRSSPHFASDFAAIRKSYDERIRLIDAAVARIREALEELRQWDDTLLIVTADHGEAFFEHGLYRHEFVPFQEVLHVPLVVSYPGWFGDRGGQVVAGAVWHPDLLPTILGLAGVPLPEGARGLDLTPVLSGQAAVPGDRAVFPAILRPAHKDQLPMRRATVRGGLKRIQGHVSYGPEEGYLFDLVDDPGERSDLLTARPDEAAELDRITGAYEAGLRRTSPVHQSTGRPLLEEGESTGIELDHETLDQLRELGYAE
jgi:choline-sulfatase